MKTVAITCVLLTLSLPGFADAPPALREVLLDNDAVEVVRMTYPVGSESGMHTHHYPNRVAYVISGGALETIPGDPEKPRQVVQVAGGQAIFLPAATHNVRNAGDTEVVIVETEIKQQKP